MSQTVLPTVTKAWHENADVGADAACRVVLQLAVGTNATTECKMLPQLSAVGACEQLTMKGSAADGAPSTLWLELDMKAATINATLTVMDKPTTRRTESASLRFAPSQSVVEQSSMQLHKVASWVAPDDVAMNGSRHIHYISDAGVKWAQHSAGQEEQAPLVLRSLDAGLVAVGSDSRPVPTVFERRTATGPNVAQPPSANVSLEGGVSVNLWNNLWQTNYVFWCGARLLRAASAWLIGG
eukprot:COSAG04_NODE_132_length_24268_cov_7.633426_20_plen_240_part_00